MQHFLAVASRVKPCSDEEKAQTPSEDKDDSSVKVKSPWKTGVHHMTPEDPQLPQMELEEPIQEQRRTTRKIKPNPRYANAAFVDEPIFVEPSSYEEASKGEWRKAMEEEIKALNNNQTWDLVPRPNEIKPISCKWVYKVKTRPDGSVERYKTRLVARGFSQ